jgi:hypothetical protein
VEISFEFGETAAIDAAPRRPARLRRRACVETATGQAGGMADIGRVGGKRVQRIERGGVWRRLLLD